MTREELKQYRATEDKSVRLAIELAVAQIRDAEVRRAVEYRYLKGSMKPTWVQVTKQIYPTMPREFVRRYSDTVRKKVERFLK
ncbi:MAG: hypothetical protein LUD03_06875 [Firmicutes bacterium]|nr:hypothetical protein [Bacillota bacterium]